jgi:hypothetical protein
MLNLREYQEILLVCQACLALFLCVYGIATTVSHFARTIDYKCLTYNMIRFITISNPSPMINIWNRR